MKVSTSHEDYLEAIVMLGGTDEVSVRSVDIAARLNVSKASVSKAIAGLKAEGMVSQQHYGDVTLTAQGLQYGEKMLARHETLTKFLSECIGIGSEIAEEEACKMEHAISDESFEKWMKYFKKVGI